MRRILALIGPIAFGLLFVTASSVFAQGGTTEGFPPQTMLFNDAVLFARTLPFFVALGIAFGVWRGKVSLRQPAYSPNSQFVTRHDLGTVITHWVNAGGFILGLITGAIVLRWLQRPDEIRGMFLIHYAGAGLVVFAVSSHLAEHGVTGGRGLIPRSLKEVREGLGEIVEYVGIFGPEGAAFGINWPKSLRRALAEVFVAFGIKPPKRLGKYLSAEKSFSYVPWAIIIGVIVLTGLVKAFRYLYPIPAPFVAWMSFFHDLFTVIAVVMFAIHLSAVLLVPRNWALLKSMFTTRIPLEYVKTRHPIWYEKLAKGQGAKETKTSTVQQGVAQTGAK